MPRKKKPKKKKAIERYEHTDKQRVNNPPVGLVTPDTDKETGQTTYAYDPHIDPALQFDSQRNEVEKIIDNGLSAETLEQAKTALQELKKRQEPYLNWAGKAEGTTFEVPTRSLHVHERIDPRTIIEAVRKKNGDLAPQLSLFESPEENPPLRQAIEFYKHKHNWSNRLIAGDSLLVMNSLLEKEGLAGQVQMIYIDPPYGIKYGSNFQPFVNKRDVRDGKDEDLTAEPEMIKAFRDTWELGIHSYLTYLRDRLFMAKELLTESGSVFIQISDENVHLVRCVLDEVFGKHNEVATIAWQKGTPSRKTIRNAFNYLLWYGKDAEHIKTKKLFYERTGIEGTTEDPRKLALWGEFENGEARTLTTEEKRNILLTKEKARIFRVDKVIERGDDPERKFEFEFEGESFTPKSGYVWRGKKDQMQRLKNDNRIVKTRQGFGYKFFLDDYPIIELTNLWDDTGGNIADMMYVVQTNEKIVQRCMLLATDPGDLVFDPTCGSGTMAFVAEQWGRRWITCDTSRVAVTLAKQRIMTALFDYYELAHPDEGVGSGFKYKTVPHITLKSIANNEPPAEEILYDQPFVDKSKSRVTGPFTVEAVPSPQVKPLEELGTEPPSDETVTRSGETLRQAEWRDELLRAGIRGKGGQMLKFSRVEPLSGTTWLHADAETVGANGGSPERTVISFGPEHAPLEQRQVALAIEEAQNLVPKPKIIVFAAFQFDPEAAKDIDETDWPGVTLLKAQMNADLLTEDLKKKRASNESFWLVGQPDVYPEQIKEGQHKGKYRVEVRGFDYYNTKNGVLESGGTDKIALWMLDPDYDGRSLYPRQVFFPMAGAKDGWARLAKNLKAEIDEELIEAYRSTVSLPFVPGDNKRVAVKIVDDRGIESLKIIGIET